MRVMLKFQDLLRANTAKLAEMITREHGKTLPDAEGEVGRGLEVVEHACSIANLQLGEYAENAATGIDVYTLIQPLGVCAGITAFNFPVMLPCFMFPIAVACGNTFVLKPSEQDPTSSLFLAELALEAGLPPGVLNVVHGGPDIANGLCEHPDIKAVSFIGSTRVGTEIYNRASAAGKRCQSMMGAKNHCVVLPDADPDVALNQLLGAAFGAAGQRCMASSVAVLVGDARNWLPDFVERAKKLKVNSGTDRQADLGPLVSPNARKRVESLIQKGVDEGAKLLLDGRNVKVAGFEQGNFVGPTIFDGVKENMTIYTEEIFGPVLCVVGVETLEDAVEFINRNPNGNGVALFTRTAARRATSRTTSTSVRWASTCRSRAGGLVQLHGLARVEAGRPGPQRQAGGAVLDADQDRHGPLVGAHQERQHDDQHALRTVPEALRASQGRHCGPEGGPTPKRAQGATADRQSRLRVAPLGASWIEGAGFEEE